MSTPALCAIHNYRCVDDTLSTSGQPRDQLFAFFAAMDRHRGERVWVHCAANMRVSVFLGLYRVIRQGWERERAFLR